MITVEIRRAIRDEKVRNYGDNLEIVAELAARGHMVSKGQKITPNLVVKVFGGFLGGHTAIEEAIEDYYTRKIGVKAMREARVLHRFRSARAEAYEAVAA